MKVYEYASMHRIIRELVKLIMAARSMLGLFFFHGWRLQAWSLVGVILPMSSPQRPPFVRYILYFCISVFLYFCIFWRLQAWSLGGMILLGLALLVVKTSICSIIHFQRFFNKLPSGSIYSKSTLYKFVYK